MQGSKDAFSGVAGAIAMGFVMTPSKPGKTAVSIGGGYYRHETAVGVNLTHWVDTGNASRRIMVNLGANRSRGASGVRVAAGFEF